MRSLLLATAAGLGLTLAGPALAQHAHTAAGHGGNQWHGASSGRWNWSGGQWRWQGGQWQARQHWGGSIGGRWIGGARAPGGWSAYHRPVKGWALPGYWLAPSFYITDWGAYGLTAPPYGYHWSRYYDDAVLVDQYGRTMDCVDDVDWDGGMPDGYADHADRDYDYSHDVGPGAPYPPPPGAMMPPPPPPEARVETRTYAYEGAPPVVVHSGPDCGCAGMMAGGWYYPPATTTTVTISSMPVTTTTTRTEYVEVAAPVVHRRTKIIRRAAPRAPSKIVRRYHTKIIRR